MNKKEALLKWIFPTTKCVICGGRSTKAYPGLCEDCLERMADTRDSLVFCSRCGTFYGKAFRNCPRCYFDDAKFPRRDGLFCAVPYDEDGSTLVKKLKYDNRRDLGETMAKLFFRFSDIEGDFDAVCAVPLHKNKQRRRGYNQSEVFARRIAEEMGLPYMELLERVTDTASQTKLTYHQRLKNMKGAFALGEGCVVKGARLLLVDDVVTTGATALECAAVLKKNGAKRVGIAVFAAAKGKDTADGVSG